MLRFSDFKKITLDDKPLFDAYFAKYPPVHSGMLFTTMICWQDLVNYHYAGMKNHLIIYTKMKDTIQVRPPIGAYDKDIFDTVLWFAYHEASEEAFGMIDIETKNWLTKHTKIQHFIEDRDFFDYVYTASDLANLAGSEYAKIRNRLNKFVKSYQYTLETITDSNMEEVAEFLKRWCLWKDCESDDILKYERKAMMFAMSHFFDLNLNGLALRIDGRIEAISVFEPMNPTTAVVHFEKGSPEYDGIYKAINLETARVLQKKYQFINRQEDMGIPGLRQAKMSYRPHHFVEVFHIEKKDIIL
ncbi:MAG: phosphatidylglycerol lysyltransferase domain-containing protein [Candidatus Thermoplasmatota archaeon]